MWTFGLKASPAQSPTWKDFDGLAVAPSEPPILEVTLIGSQLVGLRVKSGRSIRTAIERIRSGMPSRICGMQIVGELNPCPGRFLLPHSHPGE
jgi:hypothetical protein